MNKPKVLHNGWAKKRIAKFQQQCVALGGEDYRAMIGEEVPVTELPISKIIEGSSPTPTKGKRKKSRVTEIHEQPQPKKPMGSNIMLLEHAEGEFLKKKRMQGPISPPPPPQNVNNVIREVDPRQGGKSNWLMAVGAASLLSKFFI